MSATVKKITDLGKNSMHWPGSNPFIFCAYHYDKYPKCNDDSMKIPSQYMRGRDLGSDFSGKDGFSLYHGENGYAGFPKHPHYGFETLTIVRQGVVDHSDSLGMKARYGNGDFQWLTTGSGIQHAEMFPLMKKDDVNTMEMFQIWLNTPSQLKKKTAAFAIAWNDTIPQKNYEDGSFLRVYAGALDGLSAPESPPNSVATVPDSNICVATMKIQPNKGKVFIPKVDSPIANRINRVIYLFAGKKLNISQIANGSTSTSDSESNRIVVAENGGRFAIEVNAGKDLELSNLGDNDVIEIMLLQGNPIDEPVVQKGPFVCNSQEELNSVFNKYYQTQFGGWQYSTDDPVHPRDLPPKYVHISKQ